MRRAARRGTVLVAAAAALSAALAACERAPEEPDYRDVARDPAPLVDGFESYATVADARATLVRSTLLEDFERPARPGAPAHEHVLLQADEWFHLDHAGALELRFFNDRLAETVFWPRQPESYSARLRDVLTARGYEVGAARSGQRWEARSGHAVVRGLNDLDGARFAWHDARLAAQEAEWAERFAAP